ncbi:isopeptide-forming domain-containing fimbrial protein [Streptomyces eurythermus]|uniref:isopeptide-forming domain-containing fimbrial protein n=1 Tax=Streptomyces eurythermus TaxID=42237 RepID=UPI00369E136D
MSTPVPSRIALVNGSFEQPAISGLALLPDASQTQNPNHVPGWLTTATDHLIEVWHDGFQGVPAADGSQFAELNANQVSTLYQDLPSTPGATLYWRLYHRGRAGQDTMALDIGAPGAVVQQRTFTDGNTAWGLYTGTYTVPPGQTTTRFAFRSVSAAGGDPTVGNFLDGIFFGTAPSVTLTKDAIPVGPLKVGDVLTYRIVAKNQGGGNAEALTLTDTIPAGTTYVPGSLRIVDGPNAGAKTDQAGDDQAFYDPAGNRVVFRLGNGATSGQGGSLPNTDTVPGTTVEYRVRITEAVAGGHVANTATVTYENRLGPTPQQLTATSNETDTAILPAADLNVTKSADSTTVTVGQTVTYRVSVRNTGPNTATNVTVIDALPAGLTYLSATPTTGTYDPTTGHWNLAALANGASATLTLHAKATVAGPITNTATATATETDLNTGNNTDTVTVCVAPAPDCSPCGPCSPRPPTRTSTPPTTS